MPPLKLLAVEAAGIAASPQCGEKDDTLSSGSFVSATDSHPASPTAALKLSRTK